MSPPNFHNQTIACVKGMIEDWGYICRDMVNHGGYESHLHVYDSCDTKVLAVVLVRDDEIAVSRLGASYQTGWHQFTFHVGDPETFDAIAALLKQSRRSNQ